MYSAVRLYRQQYNTAAVEMTWSGGEWQQAGKENGKTKGTWLLTSSLENKERQQTVGPNKGIRIEPPAVHHPAVEADAEGQVDSRDQQQSPEPLQQNGHQAHLEHVSVEHHQEDDDDVEQDADVLDAAERQGGTW